MQGWWDARVWIRPAADLASCVCRPGRPCADNGDQDSRNARVQPAAYLYLFWIEAKERWTRSTRGSPANGHRPAERKPSRSWNCHDASKGFTLRGGQPHGDPGDAGLRHGVTATDNEICAATWTPCRRSVRRRTSVAVWFENGKIVKDDPQRFERSSWRISTIRYCAAGLMRRNCSERPLHAAVSFARQGKYSNSDFYPHFYASLWRARAAP